MTIARRLVVYHNLVFVRKADQQLLMRHVNFQWICIGNTSAPLHLLLRSWLLKVDSKHRLCWLSACLYIRTQIVGRLTGCRFQRNKPLPQWPHSLLKFAELWTVMSFIWSVCHRHFLSQVPPLCSPSLCPLTLPVFSSYQKEILSRNPLFPFISLHAIAFVTDNCEFSIA